MNETIRLLYVEDSPQDVDLTRAHFEREAPDFRLEIVENGARCLARLETETFDLLLLDNRLPDMDGLDLLGRLHASGQTLPVMMVTGSGDDEIVAKALRAGAADYVPKSEGYLATLPDLLRGLLARQRSRQLMGGNDAQRVQRILYVEHNPMDVELTTSHFSANAPHLQLHSVTSSLEALALLAPEHRFDLVLTDLRMPGMSALELIREAQHRGIDLPFIVITGKGDEATAVAILRLGAYDYIVKRDNYLIQLPHAIDHALQRFRLDQTTRYLNAELAVLNATLEHKVEDRTADLLREMEVRQASEEKFRRITESAQDAIIMMGPDRDILFWNPAAERIFGHTAAEAMGQDLHALLTTEQAQAEFAHGFPNFQKSGTGPIIGRVREVTGLRKNGEEVPLEISISAMQLKGKWHAIGILRDITERKAAEGRIRRLTGLYAALSQCNEAIVRCASEEELFTQICRAAVQFGDMKMAWVGLVDEASRRVIPVAWHGDGTAYLEDNLISTDAADPHGRGPTGTAIREDRPFWCQDFMNDPATAPWREHGARFGWGASAALPLHRKGAAIGALNLYAGKTNDFDEAARNLLLEMAVDISYALDSFDREAARRQVEMLLHESEERFRATFEQAAVGIAHVAPDGHWLRVNQRLCDIVGYTREELLASTFQDITHPDDLETDLGYVRRMLAREIPTYSLEKRYFHKNGEIVWINLTVALVRHADGSPEYFISVVEDITDRKRAEEESHLILAMGKAIAEAGNFSSALAVSIQAICESTGWDFGEVWIPSNDGTLLELGAPYYCRIEDMEGFRKASKEFEFAPGVGIPGRVWASGKPVWDTDVTVDANFPRAPFAKQAGIRAAVGIPILSENTVVAVMVFFMRKLQAEDERMTTLILAVATQLGTAFQRKRDAEHIQQLVNFDALTGLPNRVLLNDRINYSISMAQRNHAQLVVMFLDLDHFKNINDTLGHRIGDGLLIEVAKRLKSAVREEDTVSRLGGDEFILVLPGTDVDGAARAAKKLLEVIARPYQVEQHELIITPSIGIAMYPVDSEDFESLAKCADVAMYRAKADGRNGYCFFTPEMQAHSSRIMQVENALRHALERNQFQLHYQPQVSLQDGRVVGAEALLRWQHPELGPVSPAEFIPIAEGSGLILPIGEWVLRSAVRQLKTWMNSGMEPIVMAVNLSAVQFRQQRLPDLIVQILEEVQLPPQYLELELTEGVAMRDPLGAVAIMDNLYQREIRMSIDDFGTGYSSLSYLKRFHVYKLKIDQSFIRDITEDKDDKAIVGAIISMAISLGLRTIAEGVETDGQLAFLREKGCNEMQGYYLSKPLPADQFEAFVSGRRRGSDH